MRYIPINNPAADRHFSVPKTTPSGGSVDSSVLAGKLATSIASVEDFREHAKFHYDRNAGAVEGVWTWAMGLNYHEVKVSYPITVTDLPAHYDVTLGCPKALFERKVDMSLFGIFTWNNERIGTRASEACQLATITLIDPIQGEVDTPYNDV